MLGVFITIGVASAVLGFVLGCSIADFRWRKCRKKVVDQTANAKKLLDDQKGLFQSRLHDQKQVYRDKKAVREDTVFKQIDYAVDILNKLSQWLRDN